MGETQSLMVYKYALLPCQKCAYNFSIPRLKTKFFRCRACNVWTCQLCSVKRKYCSLQCFSTFHEARTHRRGERLSPPKRPLVPSRDFTQMNSFQTKRTKRWRSLSGNSTSPPSPADFQFAPNTARGLRSSDESLLTLKLYPSNEPGIYPSTGQIRQQLAELKHLVLYTDPAEDFIFQGKICKVSNVKNYPNSHQYFVSSARRRSDGVQVAIKILPAKQFKNRTFQGEIYTRAVLKQKFGSLHKIVEADAFYLFGQKLYLVMEYLPLTLTKFQRLYYLNHGRNLPEWAVANILRDLVESLVGLHQCHFIHSDIKPGNVLLDKQVNCKLTDFGQCVRMTKASMNRVHGTDGYASNDVDYGVEEDIYSVGRVALYLLQGSSLWFEYYKERTSIHRFLSKLCYHETTKDFVQVCLGPRPRPTAIELLQHEFLFQGGKGEHWQRLGKDVVRWLRKQQGSF